MFGRFSLTVSTHLTPRSEQTHCAQQMVPGTQPAGSRWTKVIRYKSDEVVLEERDLHVFDSGWLLHGREPLSDT